MNYAMALSPLIPRLGPPWASLPMNPCFSPRVRKIAIPTLMYFAKVQKIPWVATTKRKRNKETNPIIKKYLQVVEIGKSVFGH